jgi:hypothetical protein
MKSGAEHQEVPKIHAAVKPIRGLRKLHRGKHLAAGHCSQPHSTRDAVVKGHRSSRDDGRIGPGAKLQEEPRKDGRSGGDS